MADFKVTHLDQSIDFDELGHWDVVIVGAGPAGMAAGLTTAHRGLTTLIIEARSAPGGQPHFIYPEKRIVDIPGFPDGITGEELARRLHRQAEDALVQFRFGEELDAIVDTELEAEGAPLKRIVTTRGEYLARKVILACGLLHAHRKLPVLESLNTKRVYYRIPSRESFEGRRVAVIGGGDSAMDAALMAVDRGAEAHLVVRKAEPRAKRISLIRYADAGGRLHTSSEIVDASLSGERIAMALTDGTTFEADFVIVQIGFLSAKDTFQRLNLRLNSNGSITIDPYFETSRPGIFAAGDVHGDIQLITVAWAEGIQAAIYAFKEITSPYWLNERRLQDQKIAMMGDKISHAAGALRGAAATHAA